METSGKQKHRLLMLCTLIAALIYITWRIFFTLPLHNGIVSLVAGLALIIAEIIGVLEAIEHYLNTSNDYTPIMPNIPTEWYPEVDVLIATHNEDAELLYKTVNGCIHLQYPDPSKVHVFLCDDNDRPEIAELAQKMGVGYFGLSDNTTAKAGNLNNALHKTSSPLVATFDADMIPTSKFLMETVPYFFLPRMEEKDGIWVQRETPLEEEIGFIQTPQSFYNPDLFQYNLYSEDSIPNEQDYFFREVNVGRNRTNSAIYAGSNTLISRKALEQVGYIKTNSITEDFATGIEMQKQGYTCYAIDKVLAHGLSAVDISGLIKQRERWGRGCVQTMRSLSFYFSKMSLSGKFSYISSLMYWWTFLRRFIYIVSPILFTVFGVQVVNCNLWELAIFWLPYYLLYNHSLRVMSNNIRNQRWSNIVDTIIFPYMIIPIFMESIGFKQRKFFVTNKNREIETHSDFFFATPHLILTIATAVGLFFCLQDIVLYQAYQNIILIFWLVVNLYFLVMALFFMRGRVNFRRDDRLAAVVDVKVDFDGCTNDIKGKTCDISESGMSILLDFPEYIPCDQDIKVFLSTSMYNAEISGKVMHVTQIDKKWKYSIQITEMNEDNRRSYFQIIFDRHHTLSNVINSTPVRELSVNLKGHKHYSNASNRKLPRLILNQQVPDSNGNNFTLLDFNYEFLMIKDDRILTSELILTPGQGVEFYCTKVKDGKKGLYHIDNWKTLSNSPEMRGLVASWQQQLA